MKVTVLLAEHREYPHLTITVAWCTHWRTSSFQAIFIYIFLRMAAQATVGQSPHGLLNEEESETTGWVGFNQHNGARQARRHAACQGVCVSNVGVSMCIGYAVKRHVQAGIVLAVKTASIVYIVEWEGAEGEGRRSGPELAEHIVSRARRTRPLVRIW